MTPFTEADVRNADSAYPRIYADRADLIDAPLPWQQAGLQQTATGYGAKLTTPDKIRFEGKDYRLYATCYSNVASVWFIVRGRKIFVS